MLSRKYLILLCFMLIWTDSVFSQEFDSRMGVVGRSYPIGAMAVGTVGVAEKLWGEEDAIWKYGYVRAALNGATSVVVNRVGPEFQFFPISIFGIGIGHEWGVRWLKPKWAPCETIECWGRVDRTYVRVQAVAAYRSLVMMVNGRYENVRTFSGKTELFDEITILSGQASGERVFTLSPALVYRLDDQWGVGYTSILAHAIDSQHSSHLFGPLVQYKSGPKSQWILGVGQNRSNLVHPAFSMFFMFNYVIDEGLSILDKAKTEVKSPGVSGSPDQS